MCKLIKFKEGQFWLNGLLTFYIGGVKCGVNCPGS